jgi:hypothetical protein
VDMIPFGGIKISRSSPKISISIDNNRDDLTSAVLYISRVGAIVNEVAVTPVQVTDTKLIFVFGESLFAQSFGRYRARLRIGNVDRTIFCLQYVDDTILSVTNA